MQIQWNLSIKNTAGTQLVVLYREVSQFRGRFVHSSMWLGLQTVSSLKRHPLFKSVLYREVPLYILSQLQSLTLIVYIVVNV